MYMCIRICTCAYIYVHVYVHTYVYVHTCVYVYKVQEINLDRLDCAYLGNMCCFKFYLRPVLLQSEILLMTLGRLMKWSTVIVCVACFILIL